ncbi:hypothetical protein Dsin_021244 [Dipteronia sinensis]|uniref:3'-5' exonuclease domain-containing protein n=1 Tax=Dipteronia sinensis TaxID=43782 RepID=A0AAE0DYW5_9ROSI|nr:hypothetical protein Dsin_021244 [Dipteronia sinensis]
MANEFVMRDGRTIIKTVIIDKYESTVTDNCWNLFLQECETVIGFDTEWSYLPTGKDDKMETRIVLLRFCSRTSCLIVKLTDDHRVLEKLGSFLCNKDIVFAGVHIQKDLDKLQKQYGFEVRNFMDLNQLAAVREKYKFRLSLCGVRELASNVLYSYGSRPDFMPVRFSTGIQVENAAADPGDAYDAYRTAKFFYQIDA